MEIYVIFIGHINSQAWPLCDLGAMLGCLPWEAQVILSVKVLGPPFSVPTAFTVFPNQIKIGETKQQGTEAPFSETALSPFALSTAFLSFRHGTDQSAMGKWELMEINRVVCF
jgi:hypothetical protein